MELKPRTRKEFLIADFIDKDTPDIVPKTRSEMFLKQMLDKSSKPSWNNLTDKPFGSEIVAKEVLPETALSVSGGPIDIDAIGLAAGCTYTVFFDGTEYECIAETSSSGLVYIGNNVLLGGTSDTGEPFLFFEMAGRGGFAASQEGTHTCKIISEVENVTKMEPKYAPSMTVSFFSYDGSVSADKTLDELKEAYRIGIRFDAKLLNTGSTTKHGFLNEVTNGNYFQFVFLDPNRMTDNSGWMQLVTYGTAGISTQRLP